jgi:glycosyltransferase involved in cell wall biosynthesis
MKIILSAYACHPKKGSEPGVGWNWLKEISKIHVTYILFYADQGQKEAVEEAVILLPQKENIRLIPINVPKILRKRFYRIRYEVWQIKALFAAKKIINENQIDIIHQVTIAAWWFTGYYYLLNTKLIWGPISGGQYTPFKTYSFLRISDRFYETFRTIFTRISIKLSISAKATFKKADIILAANEVSLNLFNNYLKEKKCFLFSEIGVRENIIIPKNVKNNNKVKLMWSGLLIPRKNFGLLLESLKLIPENVDWELNVAGEGKLLSYWINKVDKTSIKGKIKFLGLIPFQDMQDLYKDADIFVFPSLREATGTVILEAMSYSLPVIAMNLNGAKNIIDPSCGILIEITNPKQMVHDFANAIINLCENSQLRIEIGNNARKKVEANYLWEKRGEIMKIYYGETIKKHYIQTKVN